MLLSAQFVISLSLSSGLSCTPVPTAVSISITVSPVCSSLPSTKFVLLRTAGVTNWNLCDSSTPFSNIHQKLACFGGQAGPRLVFLPPSVPFAMGWQGQHTFIPLWGSFWACIAIAITFGFISSMTVVREDTVLWSFLLLVLLPTSMRTMLVLVHFAWNDWCSSYTLLLPLLSAFTAANRKLFCTCSVLNLNMWSAQHNCGTEQILILSGTYSTKKLQQTSQMYKFDEWKSLQGFCKWIFFYFTQT